MPNSTCGVRNLSMTFHGAFPPTIGLSIAMGTTTSTGHLTKRGAEICYRLFDLGKSPMAVAYLMG
jgi:hypothetical protein